MSSCSSNPRQAQIDPNNAQLDAAPPARPKHPGQFKYQSIKYQQPMFRLLRMKDTNDPRIECELVEQTFENDSFPPYRAVSYVWGSAEKPDTIFVNGAKLKVTKNLFELLSNFKKQGQCGWLWVDGVCINQDDVREKNHQVQQMGRIYATAKQVIFYLGHSTADTDLSMHWVCKLGQLTDSKWKSYWLAALNSSRGCLVPELPLELQVSFKTLYRGLHAAMEDLLMRPWFRRAWVVQEVGNAQDGLVQCGEMTVPCPTFLIAIDLITTQTPGISGSKAVKLFGIMPTEFRGMSFLGKDRGRNLLQLLQTFARTEATCIQDRIYALLGLSGTTEDEFRVDYENSELEIIEDTISHIYRTTTTKKLKFPFPNIIVFLCLVESLDSYVLDKLIDLQDSDGVKAMLKDKHTGARLLELFMRDLSDCDDEEPVARLLSLTGGEVSVSRHIVDLAVGKFGSTSKVVGHLVRYRNARNILWENERWANPNWDSNMVINSNDCAMMMDSLRRRESTSTGRHKPTFLQRYLSDFMKNATDQNQTIGFWFTVKHWRFLGEERNGVYPLVEHSCAGIRRHDNGSCDRASFAKRFCDFMTKEPMRQERTASNVNDEFKAFTRQSKMTPSHCETLHQPFLRQAKEWYKDEENDAKLVDSELADDPDLWSFLEAEMKSMARNCDVGTIDDEEVECMWLSLIVFPSVDRCIPLTA